MKNYSWGIKLVWPSFVENEFSFASVKNNKDNINKHNKNINELTLTDAVGGGRIVPIEFLNINY